MSSSEEGLERGAWLETLFEHSQDAILTKDSEGKIRAWNPAAERLYGYTAEEALGQSIELLVPPERAGEAIALLERVMSGEKVSHLETTRMTKDGRTVHVSLAISPLRNADDEIVGASVIVRDIGDRIRIEKLESELDRKDFISKVAHELRTPLATISGYATLLKTRGEDMDASRLKEALDVIDRQSERAQVILTDILDLARIESPEFTVEPEVTNVRKIVEGACKGTPPPEGRELVQQVDGALTAVVDPGRLEQILVNLLTNAYKYGEGTVSVTARPSGAHAVISVTDEGPGVDPEFQHRLFTPFTRGPSEEAPGSGLGLSIALRLAERMQGRVEYRAGETGGACFDVFVPTP